MRILMLGWEFPPFITGGLGTACYGLTKALDRRGIEVLFVLPKAIESDEASHVRLIAPGGSPKEAAGSGPSAVSRMTLPTAESRDPAAAPAERGSSGAFEHAQFLEAPIVVSGAYTSVEKRETASEGRRRSEVMFGDRVDPAVPKGGATTTPSRVIHDVLPEAGERPVATDAEFVRPAADYDGDLLGQVHAYAQFCVLAATRERFDLIHAHDWLTYAAGLAVARITGRPLVVHVHSTEFDRSGVNVNQRVYDIERRGMHGAMKIIAVSQLTKNVIVNRYGIHPDKIEVVYNGVDVEPTQSDSIGIESKDKIVLYFGRITMQKGPEYFIRAAKRVIEYMDEDVKFVVAGSGDQAARMIEMAANLGIGHKVLFTGFLRGRDIARVFALADVYVMPSVSEPFGIAPLEAMGHDVPVIISKSSGVSEVLIHALKVDFWDVDDIANKIIAVLKYPPLSRTLRERGSFEIRRLTWDGAADRCDQVYRAILEGVRHHSGRR